MFEIMLTGVLGRQQVGGGGGGEAITYCTNASTPPSLLKWI